MLCCLLRHVEPSCHNEDSLMRGASSSVSCDQQTPPLNANSNECHWPGTDRRQSVCNTWRDKARYWSKI